MTRQDLVAAALFVWNPLTEPETIRVHVEHHRATAGHPQGRFTWWGRIVASDNPSLEYTLNPMAAVQSQFESDPSERVVLVTDYTRLHALRIDRCILNDAHDPLTDAPDYYRGKRCGLWLRVRDIRAISHDGRTTLTFLSETTKADESGRWGIDPYASKTQLNPRVIWAPKLDDLFDPRVAGTESGYFADRPDTVDPPVIAEARLRLEKTLGSEAWSLLEEYSRSALAFADALYDDMTFSPRVRRDVDGSPIVLGIANAVERELVQGCLMPLCIEANDTEVLALAPLRALPVEMRQRPTLGTLATLLRKQALVDWAHGGRNDITFAAIVRDRSWGSWITKLAALRNDAAHGREVSQANVCGVAEHVLHLAGMPDRVVEVIARAKSELRRLSSKGDGL